MDNKNKIYDLLEKVYFELQETKSELQETNLEVKGIKNKVTIIEQDHGKKLDALFDGYKQNSDKLDKIEEEVSKHEEVI